MSFFDELNQRTNQLNSEMGWPAFVDPNAVLQLNKDSLAMANASFARLSYLDGHDAAQEIAMKTIHGYRDSLQGEFSIAPEISQGGLLVLFGHDPSIPVPFDQLAQWESVATEHLGTRYTRCDVQITVTCSPKNATKIMPVKVGEFVCVYKVCTNCREWFDLTPAERDNFGGSGWFDDIDRR